MYLLGAWCGAGAVFSDMGSRWLLNRRSLLPPLAILFLLLKNLPVFRMVVYAHDSSNWKAETGGSGLKVILSYTQFEERGWSGLLEKLSTKREKNRVRCLSPFLPVPDCLLTGRHMVERTGRSLVAAVPCCPCPPPFSSLGYFPCRASFYRLAFPVMYLVK